MNTDLSPALTELLAQMERRWRHAPGSLDGAQLTAELREFGLCDRAAGLPAWELLDEQDWVGLLRGLCRLRPGCAVLLASQWLGEAVELPPKVAFAMLGAGDADYWQLRRPLAGDRPEQWSFIAEGRLWRVSVGALRQVGLQSWECRREQAHAGACARAWAGLYGQARQALLDGAMAAVWQSTLAHVAARTMFNRRMIELPALQMRLLGAHACLQAGRCAPFRLEMEQICGGTGYMAESASAQALQWLGWAEDLAAVRAILPEPNLSVAHA